MDESSYWRETWRQRRIGTTTRFGEFSLSLTPTPLLCPFLILTRSLSPHRKIGSLESELTEATHSLRERVVSDERVSHPHLIDRLQTTTRHTVSTQVLVQEQLV